MSKQLHKSYKVSGILLACLLASACGTVVNPSQRVDRLDYQSDRYADMKRLDDYTVCQNQGYQLSQKAETSADIATYLASARALTKCDDLISDKPHLMDSKTQMQARAIAILNFIKGGDVTQARQEFDSFKRDFGDKDLTFQDGTSFLASVSLIIYPSHGDNALHLATSNARPDLKRELRRLNYWGAH